MSALAQQNRAPATIYARRIDPKLCAADVARTIEIFERIKAGDESLEGWVNFPIINGTGQGGDVGLKPYDGPPRTTELAAQLPAVSRIVDDFLDEGLSIRIGRIAILGRRDVLRPHVDTFPNTRLLIPLTEQGDDFRHLYDNACFAMRVGEVWGGDGTTCHGAANVAETGHRVLLLLDVVGPGEAEVSPPWLRAPWRIPPSSFVRRALWSEAVRTCEFGRIADGVRQHGPDAAERELLLLPFEFAMPANYVYREMLLFAQGMITRGDASGFWQRRADALLNPTLPFQVPVPN
jgi:hypothetical protein